MEPALPLPPSTSHFFYDEWPHVEAMARLHPNLVTHACPAGVMADEMYPVRLFHARGQPIRNLINIAWFGAASAKVRALGASVLLTGHSGNYTLSYDGRAWFMDLAASGRLLRLWCEIQDLAQQGLSRWAELRRVGATVAPAWCRMLMRRLRGRAAPWWYFSAIHPGFAADLHAARLLQDIRPAQREHGWNADVWRLGLERTWRARDMQAAMRPYYGYETRDPLGDVRLIEFCIALPPEQYVRHGVTRFLARRVLADRVPPQITQERRHGLQNPQWFSRLSRHRSAMAEALELLQQSPLARRVLDLPRLQALMHAWPTNADTAQFLPLVAILSRGINIGQFIQWVENGRPL
jgi:asparagine synthase (glutamine-hydrolysing)